MPGSHRCFCSSEPYAQIGYITSELCTLANERMPESPRSSSWQIRPYAVGEMPAQPYPVSDGPRRPISPNTGTSSCGNVPAVQCLPIAGITRDETSSRTVSRTIRSS